MKLNLLPQTEKKSRAGRSAILVGGLIVLISAFAAGALTFIPKGELENARQALGNLPQDVANVDATAKSADVVIAKASDVMRNAQLAKAMIDHNDVYPKLYDDLKRYIPPYYRLQSISAEPAGPGMSVVTMTGTLQGYQRYADLMLALMRFKDATTITRSGYELNDPIVPPVTDVDQAAKMRRSDEEPVPDDGLERLAYFQNKAASAPQGYLGVGNYGSGTTDTRGALPDASIVTIVMNVNRDLRVPLPLDTLRQNTGGGAAGATGMPNGMGMSVGAPGMGAPPMGAPAMGGGGGRMASPGAGAD